MGLEWLQRVFGDKVLQFVMILFTYERRDTILDDLKKNPDLEQLLKRCGGRYHTCNKMMNNQSEMKDLMKKMSICLMRTNSSATLQRSTTQQRGKTSSKRIKKKMIKPKSRKRPQSSPLHE
ncbi:hypothetical protein QQF64_034652 [Cirrhinus molitorella]|uniref:AIG1-type G domain-containing protein n=1 Tax=Cirrhinus molitorella TaxID=172907 RepID=A0ABR3L111_9TELE